MPDAPRVEQDLRLAIEGSLDVHERLARRRSDAIAQDLVTAAPAVAFVDNASHRASVLEVRAHDVPGLLHAVAHAISDSGADIVGARIATLGSEAIDVFYLLSSATGLPLTIDEQHQCRQSILDGLIAL